MAACQFLPYLAGLSLFKRPSASAQNLLEADLILSDRSIQGFPMSVSGISDSGSPLRAIFQRMRANKGVTKADIAELGGQFQDTDIQSRLQAISDSFEKIDIDSDGKLETSEMAVYRRMNREQSGSPGLSYEQVNAFDDTTGNDSLAALAASFELADTNKDGRVSHVEFAAFEHRDTTDGTKVESAANSGSPSDSFSKTEIERSLKREEPSLPANETLLKAVASAFSELDADKNGKISRGEFKAFADDHRVERQEPNIVDGPEGDVSASSLDALSHNPEAILRKLIAAYSQTMLEADNSKAPGKTLIA